MSSQFLSSLLMASPVAEGDVTISIKDELISAPYVSLTIGLMKKFGVNVQIDGDMKGTPSFTIPADVVNVLLVQNVGATNLILSAKLAGIPLPAGYHFDCVS